MFTNINIMCEASFQWWSSPFPCMLRGNAGILESLQLFNFHCWFFLCNCPFALFKYKTSWVNDVNIMSISLQYYRYCYQIWTSIKLIITLQVMQSNMSTNDSTHACMIINHSSEYYYYRAHTHFYMTVFVYTVTA